MNRAVAESGQLLTGRDVHVVIEPRLVSLEVAGRVYGDLSAEYIADLQDTAEFPLVRLGRRRLVPVAQADAWFAARQQQGSAA